MSKEKKYHRWFWVWWSMFKITIQRKSCFLQSCLLKTWTKKLDSLRIDANFLILYPDEVKSSKTKKKVSSNTNLIVNERICDITVVKRYNYFFFHRPKNKQNNMWTNFIMILFIFMVSNKRNWLKWKIVCFYQYSVRKFIVFSALEYK